MAIIQLKSTNPAFSFLIKKNPASGMVFRGIRKGIATGWFSAEGTYHVFFQDAQNTISFKGKNEPDFDYLNLSKYTSPFAYLQMTNDFFRSVYTKENDQDTRGFKNRLVFSMIYARKEHYLRFFKQHFENYDFTVVKKTENYYEVAIETEETLGDLLKLANVFCLFLAMNSKESIQVEDSLIQKYIQFLIDLDVPYFIRYLFAQNFLFRPKTFQKFKKQLEATEKYDIELQFGGTHLQRRNAILARLDFSNSIVDIGCGEGFYAIPFAKKLADTDFYYAIDIDTELLRHVEKRASREEIENIGTYESFEHFLENAPTEKVDVLLTEVIEHMPIKQADKLVTQVLNSTDFEHFIVTTPNRDFNAFYELEDAFRHTDHKFESSAEEFQDWLREIVGRSNRFEVDFFQIGDKVNGISTSSGAIIYRKEVE
ncbi:MULTISPECIES: methyltransferase domain-containing protein [Listeria]|uniref:methyltransferase domain-containing protein n=1 Tax=Listeria TaxID=1637 RepID=UPI000B58F427|nr:MULTISPECIES: methyltransferase domain-containing protein [Listeria]